MWGKYSTNRGNRLTLQIINSPLRAMNRFIRYIFLVVTAIITAATAQAQEDMKLLLGVGLDTFFDNTEYTGTNLGGSSGTTFSARLTPQIGVEWDEKNSLVIGADLFADFGNDTKFLSKARPQLYYRFAAPKVKAYAGIFDRSAMKGYYSELFFSDVYRYYNMFDAMTFPSLHEGFGIVMIEGQANGCAVIGSTNIPEQTVITENATRLPIDNENAVTWADKIVEFSKKSRESGIEKLKEQGFDIKVESEKLRNEYLN